MSETEELHINADRIPRDDQFVGGEGNRNETRSGVGNVALEVCRISFVFESR